MKKLIVLVSILSLFALPAFSWTGFKVSLPNETDLSFLPDYPNFQTKPYYNISLNAGDIAFTTELISQSFKGYKVLYLDVGYTASNKWTGGAGLDILNGLRALGLDVQTPVEDVIKKYTGVESFKMDFFVLYDPSIVFLQKGSITVGIGGVIYEFRNTK